MLLSVVLTAILQAGTPSLETVSRGTISWVNVPQQVVARTSAEWTALWRREAPLPAVDFASRTVVAVFLGSRPSAGFGVEITGTREQGGVLTVLWRERMPGAGDVTAQVLTSPFHIASIPKFAGEIRFEKAVR